jgi:peptide/nickel transport system permease protein
MLFYAQGANAELTGYWWWFIPPGLAVALLGTSLVLLNFGIDEFVNPRLRAAGLSRRSRRRGGARALRSPQFAMTPVIRTLPAGTTPGTPAEQARATTPGTPTAQARETTPETPVEEGQA